MSCWTQSFDVHHLASSGSSSGGRRYDVDYVSPSVDVEGQLTDLRLMTAYLENELNTLRQENADFRRDVMTSSLRGGGESSLTADDLSRLIAKMTEVVNDTRQTTNRLSGAAAGFPRGTVLPSVLQPSSIRGSATPWTYFLRLSLSSLILTDSTSGSHYRVKAGSRVVNVLDSGAVGPEIKSQSRRCRVTVLGKLFTPIVSLFTKQQNW